METACWSCIACRTRRTASHIFSGATAQAITGFRGSAITWIANDSALLLNGRYVLDSQNFDQLGDLGIDNVKGVYALDRSTLALTVSTDRDQAHCSVMVASLNAKTPRRARPSTSDGDCPRKARSLIRVVGEIPCSNTFPGTPIRKFSIDNISGGSAL